MSRRRRKLAKSDAKSKRLSADTEVPRSKSLLYSKATSLKWLLPLLIAIAFGVTLYLNNQEAPESPQVPEKTAQQSLTDLYLTALRSDPKNHEAHYNLGLQLQSKGNMKEAISHYRQAISLENNDARYHNNLAAALAMQGQLEEAIKHFRMSLSIEPDNIEARYNLGNASFSNDQLEEAIIHFRKVIELKPSHSKAHNNLAVALKKTGKLEEAYKHRFEAMRLEREQQSGAQ